jgi:hypothetical protein
MGGQIEYVGLQGQVHDVVGFQHALQRPGRFDIVCTHPEIHRWVLWRLGEGENKKRAGKAQITLNAMRHV